MAGNNGNGGVKHGLFALLPRKMKIDRRTKFGRAVRDLRLSLEEDMGGDGLSAQRRAILDRVVFKILKLSSYEAQSLKGDDASMKSYLAMSNSLRLDLMALGLEKKEPEPESLEEYIRRVYPENGGQK